MSNKGPIVLIEDDPDDMEVTRELIREIGVNNEVVAFQTTKDAFGYLLSTPKAQHFIILCDINLPGGDGLEFKKHIDSTPELRKKSIPFIFFSTAHTKEMVNKAYEYSLQGFFTKEFTYNEQKKTFQVIFDYWTRCRHPNE